MFNIGQFGLLGSSYLDGIMADVQGFHSLAGQFGLLALAFDESKDPEQREDLLTRMKAVIDELEERIIQEATLSAAFR